MVTRRQERNETIRNWILDRVAEHPTGTAQWVAEQFRISRQAAHRHLKHLVQEGLLRTKGLTRAREYYLSSISDQQTELEVHPGLAEDEVWRDWCLPQLKGVKANVLDICNYCFTEMLNNVVDHSQAYSVELRLLYSPKIIAMELYDNGIGVFEKLRKELGLADQRHAVLELAKGKLTTDPERHTGEGIFFTSRMLDGFNIVSGGLSFSKQFEDEREWLLEDEEGSVPGTLVQLEIDPKSDRTSKEIFDRFASDFDEYGFTRTRVPVKLAQYEGESLVSRSQAKRLLARFEDFQEVVLSFEGVTAIGQAFADEIFRVFRNQHPETNLTYLNATSEVTQMISRALGAEKHAPGGNKP